MTYLVTEACINCEHTGCVEVYPEHGFVEGPNFLAVDADNCIDRSLCVADCPVGAIYVEDQVLQSQVESIRINAEVAKARPAIIEKKDAPEEVQHWAQVKDKRALLEMA
jgi:ferredoxin